MIADGMGNQKHQAELRIRGLAFTKDCLGNLAHKGQGDGRLILALRVQKRFQQFALVDADQVPRLPFEIPDTNMGKQLESRAEAALGQPGAPRNATHSPGLTIQKAHQAIPFPQWVTAKDNRLRLFERHSICRRADRLLRRASAQRKAIANKFNYHTKPREAIEKRDYG
jgi:hypothetical protein